MKSSSDPNMGRRCVVWHRCGVEPSAALLNALSSRGLRVETSGSGHEVLAMGCREQQLGGTEGRGLIVVLDGCGDDLDGQGRVLEGMERFCPSGLVWVYENGANPPLRGLVGDGGRVAVERKVMEGKKVPVVDGAVEGTLDGGGLRLSGVNGGVKNGAVIRASDVLDRDELDALLKPEE